MYPNRYKPFSGIFIKEHISILRKQYNLDCIVATGGGSNNSTLMIFKNGNVEATKVGALSKSQLTAFIDSNL